MTQKEDVIELVRAECPEADEETISEAVQEAIDLVGETAGSILLRSIALENMAHVVA